MALTQLDKITALIVIDLQKGIVALPTAHPIEPIIERAGLLAETFRRNHLPVVLVNVTDGAPGRTERTRNWGTLPADWAELVAGLHVQPSDHLVTKRTGGAFTNTGLEAHLKLLGVTQVVIVGVSTSFGVESTARQAHELGFNVTVAVDAMTDTDLEAHHNSVTRLFPRISETGTTQEVIDLLGSTRG
jgi:nicotinamidase-related amidase